MRRKVIIVCFITLCLLVLLVSRSSQTAGKPDVTRHEAHLLGSAVNMHIEWQSPNPVVIVKISVAAVEKEINIDAYDNKRNRDGYAGEVTVTMDLDQIPTQNFIYVIQLEDELRIKSPLITGKVNVAKAKQPQRSSNTQPSGTKIQQTIIQGSGSQPGKKPDVKPSTQPPSQPSGEQVGSIIVIIEPQIMVDSGAMWRVKSRPWKKSGETITDLSIGTYTIEFQEVGGWIKPENQNVTIKKGQTSTFKGIYRK